MLNRYGNEAISSLKFILCDLFVLLLNYLRKKLYENEKLNPRI